MKKLKTITDLGMWFDNCVSRYKRRTKHVWQKLTRGFSDADLYNLDHTLAEYMLPRIKAYRSMYRSGVPNEIAVKHESKHGSGITDFKKATREWDYILDTIIVALQDIVDEWDYKDLKIKTNKKSKASKINIAKQRKAHEDKVKEGLKNMGEWFRDLWD